MSTPDPGAGGSNPFGGIFGELAKMLGSSSGPLNWDIARQVAQLIAAEGQSEPNVEPLDRIRIEELARLAEMHVNQIDGLAINVRSIDTLSHVEWAARSLEAYKEILDNLAASLGTDPSAPSQTPSTPGADPFADIQKWMSPVLLGMQTGGMVGHLARRCLGQYDMPIPRDGRSNVVFVPANIKEFSESWSLPLDELTLYVAIEETIRTAIFMHDHVGMRFNTLINEYVSGFEPERATLDDRFTEMDLSDPSSLQNSLDDPETLLGAIQTPAQQDALAHLRAMVAVFAGYVDHVAADIASRTIASGGLIAEAAKRRRVEEASGQRLVEKLLGIELNQAQFDRGEAFVKGVLERDASKLSRLWTQHDALPTPAEVDAPGLWIERIDLPPIS